MEAVFLTKPSLFSWYFVKRSCILARNHSTLPNAHTHRPRIHCARCLFVAVDLLGYLFVCVYVHCIRYTHTNILCLAKKVDAAAPDARMIALDFPIQTKRREHLSSCYGSVVNDTKVRNPFQLISYIYLL